MALERPTTNSVSKSYTYGPRRAWSAVFGASLLQMVTVGVVSSFGVTQTFYVNDYLRHTSSSAISWIGSTAIFLQLGVPLLVGKMGNKIHYRIVLCTGSIVFLLSLFMLSLAKPERYYQIFLAQGVGMGIGVGIIYLPLFVIVSTHFKARKALAMGIITSSASCGSIAFSVALNYLLNSSLGFGWSIRIVAFVVLACLVVGIIFIPDTKSLSPGEEKVKETSKETSASETLDSLEHSSSDSQMPAHPTPRPTPIWKDTVFILILLEGFSVSLGTWFPAFFVQLFASQHGGARIPREITFYAIAIMNAGNAAGRVVPNLYADRWGALKVYVICVVCCGALSFGLLGCTTTYGLVLFCLFYGFFFGATTSLYLPVIALITPPEADVGKRMGIALFPVALATLIGTPLSAALLTDSFVWWRGVVFSAMTILLGGVFAGTAAWKHHWVRREGGV